MDDEYQELVQEIRAGDTRAFESVFRHYQPRLFRFLWHLVRSSEVAEDLVQSLFLNIWKNRKQWHVNSSLTTYLYRAAKNAALNYLRSRTAHSAVCADLDHLPDNETRPDQDYDQKELRVLVQQAIDSLPPGCRTVFVLSRYENLKYQDIAEVLDISVKTVENQMGRALRLLRQKLTPFLKLTK